MHRQLYDELRRAILGGHIAPGSRLPASRELAHVTRVSRNTVLSAYDQLSAEGFIESRAGSGTYIAKALFDSASPVTPAPAASRAEPTALRRLSRRGQRFAGTRMFTDRRKATGHLLRPGLPALDHFPMDVWRRLTDRRLRRASVRVLAYDDPQGYLPLREAIASHLVASRGARCTAGNVIVVNGSQQAIDLVTRVLLDEDDAVWMEDPGYFAARAAFAASGCRVVAVPVDGEGMNVAAGAATEPDARLVYCTPSHQNPTGVTMSLARRMALLQWAERSGAWILEDDNASEYRYRGRPLAALQGIDSAERVLYAGTFSKVLYSSLRVGYLVAPTDLVPALVSAREISDRQTAGLLQAVLADFINEGHFARHLRRMRTLYSARLEAFVAAVRQHGGGLLELDPGEGGMSRLLLLPPDVDENELALELSRLGLQCVPLGEYCLKSYGRAGLVCGFTGIDEIEIGSALKKLAETVGAHVRGRLAPA